MKKVISVLLFVCILCTSISCFAAKKESFGNFPGQASANATKSSSGRITPYINDGEPWTAYGGVNGDRNVKLGSDSYYCSGFSKSRVTGNPSALRDIDYIYVRIRAYNTVDSILISQNSSSDSNACDVSTQISSFSYPDGHGITFYGTHMFKESGYNDITLETSKAFN